MAYNAWNNAGYQPYYYGTQGNPYQPQQAFQPSPSSQGQQIQNGGFVRVRNENDARMYPVAPGNSVTFIDENSPYCYVKTMGFSQLDQPKFERYRLVKEEIAENIAQQATQEAVAPPDIIALKEQVNALRAEIDGIKERLEPTTRKPTRKVADE